MYLYSELSLLQIISAYGVHIVGLRSSQSVFTITFFVLFIREY